MLITNIKNLKINISINDCSIIKCLNCNFLLFSIPICRLWAEVFHVTTSSSGTVKWTQVSEDLVPVNITCIQDSPEVIFHITAYNSQVEKILDVRLLQPGRYFLSKGIKIS